MFRFAQHDESTSQELLVQPLEGIVIPNEPGSPARPLLVRWGGGVRNPYRYRAVEFIGMLRFAQHDKLKNQGSVVQSLEGIVIPNTMINTLQDCAAE